MMRVEPHRAGNTSVANDIRIRADSSAEDAIRARRAIALVRALSTVICDLHDRRPPDAANDNARESRDPEPIQGWAVCGGGGPGGRRLMARRANGTHAREEAGHSRCGSA